MTGFLLVAKSVFFQVVYHLTEAKTSYTVTQSNAEYDKQLIAYLLTGVKYDIEFL